MHDESILVTETELRGRRHDFLLALRDDQRREPHIRQCPLTINVRDDFRLNVNAGWLRDTTDDANHLTWGAGVEWDFRKPGPL
jgi:hypothetical protein